MTLGNLLYEIREKYREVSTKLSGYMYIPEVESFVRRRGEKLQEFEEAVRGYNLSELTGNVLNSLRFSGVSPKIYGICMRGSQYFEVTKKVEKLILEEVERSTFEKFKKEMDEEVDDSYIIFDEN